MNNALEESETLIQEVVSADAIVLGVPMYNFGIPAQLKAYFDQIVRIGRTFAYDPEAADPYKPLLASRPCVAITAVSDAALYPGGALAHANFVEQHLKTLWTFIGINELTFVRLVEENLRTEESLAELDAVADKVVRIV